MDNESTWGPVPGTYWAEADEATRQRWRNADLWSSHDLSALCCGLVPDKSRPASAPVNEADEAIRRAVLAKVLPVISPVDATAGDHLYGHDRFFKPADATRWASRQFPAFPYSPSDFQAVLPGEVANAKQATRETTYLNIIGAMLELVLGKTPAGKPQSVFESQAAIIDALIAHHGTKPGISKTTLEAKFAEARRQLNST